MPTTRPTTRPTWRPIWFVGVGLGLAATLAFTLVPAGSSAATLTYQAIAAIVVLTMLVILVRMPPSRGRAVWFAVWGYAFFALAGDVAYYAEALAEVDHITWSHALYFAGYGCALIALVLLVRTVHPDRDVEAAIDTLIIAIAMASVVYLLIVEPTIELYVGDTREMLLAVAYPLVDLALLAALIRALVGSGRLNPAVVILLGAFAVTFVADLLYSYVGAGGLDGVAPAWLDAIYLMAFVMLAAAAAAPGADLADPDLADPDRPDGTESTATGRTFSLSVGALLVPGLLLVAALGGDADAARVLALASVLVILPVLWRFRTLLAVVDRQSRRLSSLARIDALTGLPNRRTLDHQVERLQVSPVAGPVSVAMLDLDLFKGFNDAYGHAAGDAVLVASADAWSQVLADVEGPPILARYGGEEFACVLPGLDLDRAGPILERVRLSTPRGHSVSIGCAQVDTGETVFAAMGRADRALYRAKRTGRNRVVVDDPGAEPS